MNKVYLAGGLRSNWQRKVIEACGNGMVFYNPRLHELDDPHLYTSWDIFHIDKSDILFGYLEQSNPSGVGLALEIGYAKALKKLVILVDEKTDSDEQESRYFQIVRESSDVIFDSLEEGINYLMRFRML